MVTGVLQTQIRCQRCQGLDAYSSEHEHSWQHCVSFDLLREGLGRWPEDIVLKENLLAPLAHANWNSSLISFQSEMDQCKVQRLKAWICPLLSCIK